MLVFGSTTDKHPCQASFNVDNVMIYIKWNAFLLFMKIIRWY